MFWNNNYKKNHKTKNVFESKKKNEEIEDNFNPLQTPIRRS